MGHRSEDSENPRKNDFLVNKGGVRTDIFNTSIFEEIWSGVPVAEFLAQSGAAIEDIRSSEWSFSRPKGVFRKGFLILRFLSKSGRRSRLPISGEARSAVETSQNPETVVRGSWAAFRPMK